MELEEMLGILAFAVAMAILTSASISDWKKREVSDRHWIVLGAFGLIMFVCYSVHLTGFRWEYVCLAGGTLMIFLDIFWDKEFNPLLFYILMALLFIIPLYGNMSENIMKAWVSVPACYVIYLCMYVLNVVRGGADVKCLISLSVMFPLYPQFFGLPLVGIPGNMVSQIFVFSISVLFTAAVMTSPAVLYFLSKNAKEGVFSLRFLSGYRMDISKAENSDVWPLEDIVNGELTPIKVPKEEDIESIYSRLREAGHGTVWITPMIPFIIMISAATAIVALLGSPLFFIVHLLF